jgi:hypothetical protein
MPTKSNGISSRYRRSWGLLRDFEEIDLVDHHHSLKAEYEVLTINLIATVIINAKTE